MQHVIEKIIEIVISNFPNGIRDDFIDTNKVRRIYSASHSDENISRDLIAEVIRTNGIENNGRFYFISKDDAKKILRLLDEILWTNSVAYYSAVHERHRDFFASLHIFSPEVLKKILQKICTGYFYFDEFCSATKMPRLDCEVSKIFMATENPLSLEDLQKKLPYVPSEKIFAVLAYKTIYSPTINGKYILTSSIKFDIDEIYAANRKISACIDANGYAAPEDYDLSSNFALNPELTEKDLRNVIYEKFFSVDFTKRGKKFFGKDAAVRNNGKDLTSSLRKFIAEQEELSDEKLFTFAENLRIVPHVALYIVREKMTRVAKNLFVQDSLISFDIAGVDEALMSFVRGKIIPLRGVTSFTGFPPVEGYSWNLFLLESFLRKYSKKYSYAASADNNANIGAIYPKSMKFADYLDVQVAVIVQEKIPLNNSAVEDFLIEQGFRARRDDNVIQRIIDAAQENFR